MRASLCMPYEGLMGWWLLRPTITIWPFNRNFLTVDFFHDYRLKFGNFYAYRLNVLAVLWRSVNLIENYFVCIKNREVTGASWILRKFPLMTTEARDFFYLKPFPLSIRVMKFFYIPFHFIFTAELWFQCFQLQAALHVIPGKCSTKTLLEELLNWVLAVSDSPA